MKKILIVDNNLSSGGIQKALVNLLRAIADQYEVTLLLFSPSGPMMAEIPPQVQVLSPGAIYKTLGLTRTELSSRPFLYVAKGILKVFARLSNKRLAMRICGLLQKPFGRYDAAISYTHMTHHKSFDTGCAEFVLDKVQADQKICFIHCDYGASGFASQENNAAYHAFDRIVCVSESVRSRFLSIVPDLEEKTMAIRNFYDLRIRDKARAFPVDYASDRINLVLVARLSAEKGIDRAIEALKKAERTDIMLHIVGDGPQREALQTLCRERDLMDRVRFYGEQSNPYPYMAAADYLLMSSLHEAAPMVFDEAHVLGLPILSVELLSTKEMLKDTDMECPNSTEGLTEALVHLQKCGKKVSPEDSNRQIAARFAELIDGKRLC